MYKGKSMNAGMVGKWLEHLKIAIQTCTAGNEMRDYALPMRTAHY